MPPDVNDRSELLNQLRIDRSAPVEEESSRRGIWIGAAIVLLLAGGGAAWWMLRAPAALEVTVVSAKPMATAASAASVLDATGYVTARRQATVSSKVTGKVREVLIEEGMRVEEGQVMARLEDTEARAQLELSTAQRESALAQLGEIRAQLAQTERDLKRQQDMDARKLTSQQALDNAATQVAMLRARLATAERQATVASRSLDVAKVQLDNTTVRAPFAGVVIAKAAQPGEMISPLSAGGGFTRTGVGTIVDMDSLEVEVDVNEAYINRVQPGQPAEAVLNAYADWKIPAAVIAISPTADRSKATVKVRVALKLKDPRIVPDMGVRVAFLEERKSEAAGAAPAPRGVLVPAGAVRSEGDKSVVFTVREGKAQRHAVATGGNVGDQRQVLSGIGPGDGVIVDAPADLKDGTPVKPKQ